MPLPFILGAAAVVAGLTGVGTGINGAVKMKDANDTMKIAKNIHENSIEKFKKSENRTKKTMDNLGEKEMKILNSFKDFLAMVEIIKNKPKYDEIKIEDVELPEYDPDEIKKVSVGAGVILGGLKGAAVGTAGGFAAAGATTSAVAALGTASTGTAIASLSGGAALNATLAAIGGGAISAGGGGIALGNAILGASTLGVGLLVGGVIFNFSGNKLSDKADEALHEAKKQEKLSNKICAYLDDLNDSAISYSAVLNRVNLEYMKRLEDFTRIVYLEKRTDFKYYSKLEKAEFKSLVLLVPLLKEMCKVNLVKKTDNDKELNEVNKIAIQENISNAEKVLDSVA